MRIIDGYAALLLDMNDTFMFNADRFGPSQNYYETYATLGGTLPKQRVHTLIDACYAYLDLRYPDPAYHDNFPRVTDALQSLTEASDLESIELHRLADTFALHELGHISSKYADVLHQLASSHTLALVADIWADKRVWLEEFKRAGVHDLFKAMVFSSEIGSVKPSPNPFLSAIEQLNVPPHNCVVIGDSIRRDIGGAEAAGVDAIWIGNDTPPPYAIASYPDLADLVLS